MNIRKLARPAAALLAAAALMAGIPELRMEAQAAFPEYLKSVTYFGDAWPINYWGQRMTTWGKFCPHQGGRLQQHHSRDPVERVSAGGYGKYVIMRLLSPSSIRVMKCADDHGLMVTLRIGYCWDYSGEASLPSDMPVWCRTEAMTGRCG